MLVGLVGLKVVLTVEAGVGHDVQRPNIVHVMFINKTPVQIHHEWDRKLRWEGKVVYIGDEVEFTSRSDVID